LKTGIRNEAGLCRAVGVECHAYISDCQLAPRHDTPTSGGGTGAEAGASAI